MTPGREVTIEIVGRLDNLVTPGEDIFNAANIDWSSLPGDVSNRSDFVEGNLDSERTGDEGPVNDYNVSDTAVIEISSLIPEKFVVSTSEPGTASTTETIDNDDMTTDELTFADGSTANSLQAGLEVEADNTPVTIGEIIRYRLRSNP